MSGSFAHTHPLTHTNRQNKREFWRGKKAQCDLSDALVLRGGALFKPAAAITVDPRRAEQPPASLICRWDVGLQRPVGFRRKTASEQASELRLPPYSTPPPPLCSLLLLSFHWSFYCCALLAPSPHSGSFCFGSEFHPFLFQFNLLPCSLSLCVRVCVCMRF